MSNKRIKIMLVEDQKLMRVGIRSSKVTLDSSSYSFMFF